MYDVALSVLSCLKADTDVHVAWVAGSAAFLDEAVAITPGGGRMGSLLGGALDHIVTEAIPGVPSTGGLVEVAIGPLEALQTGLDEGATFTLAIVPGTALPTKLWEDLAGRRPVSFALTVEGQELSKPKRLDPGEAVSTLTLDRLVTSLVPIPRVVISGSGPIADALYDAFALVGWRPSVVGEVGAATGIMATLAAIDGVVVIGHDSEQSGLALQGAISSKAGYIGSVGSDHMQDLRREWLAYRGVEWDDRIRGPAGLSIGASNPGEIALSIAAEAVAVMRSIPDDPGELA